jgi:hypothetical protein
MFSSSNSEVSERTNLGDKAIKLALIKHSLIVIDSTFGSFLFLVHGSYMRKASKRQLTLAISLL